jgi:hypothetical protein
LSWTALAGANSYAVDYQVTGAATWTSAATVTTVTSISITGLTASTGYTWRVRASCSSGVGAYATGTFTTSAPAPACVTAFEPNETLATALAIVSSASNSAAISSATDIDYYKITTTASSNIVYTLSVPTGVDYDLYVYNSAGTQLGSSLTTTATETVTLNTQAAGTYYVKVIGYLGANSTTCYTIKATATAIVSCQSSKDTSTNNATTGAAVIPFNTNITGLVEVANDVDHYKFTITKAGTITLTLTTLPLNYNLRLVNSAGTVLVTSQNTGTTSETINYTATVGIYYARVYATNASTFSATSCYTLKVALGTAAAPEQIITTKGLIKIYPNPVSNILNVSVLGEITNRSTLDIVDVTGAVVMSQKMINNPQALNISSLPRGTYMIKVRSGLNTITAKFIKK